MNILQESQYAWFLWSLIFVGFWAVIYALLPRKESRHKMLVVSLWTSLVGLTEPFFVPAYWNPPSLFDLAHRTGFDIESVIFSFAMGGIAVALYERMFEVKHLSIASDEKMHPRHHYHLAALLSSPAIFFTLYFLTSLNPIYDAIIALILGGFATWYCRPDLKMKMITGAFLFLGLYFVYFLTLVALFPGYVERVWNLPALSGILIFGVPFEELMFAFGVGFLWSSVYEHVTWKKLRQIK